MATGPETDVFPTGKHRTSSYLRRFGISSAVAHLALCIGTAVLLTLAFPRPGWSFMAHFALVPAGVLVMRTTSLRRLAWTSYLVFFLWWMLRLLWLREVSPIAPVGTALVMGGYFSLTLVALAAVQRRFRGTMTATLPVFWCAQEALRSRFPWGGFGWFNLSASQANWRVGQPAGLLVQNADLFGELTVSFLIGMTSGLLVDLIARPISKRGARGRLRPRRTIVVAALVWGGLILSALLYGRHRIQQAQALLADGPTITVIQTNVPQDNKVSSTPEQRAEREDELFVLSEQAVRDHPDTALIVWPETMAPYPVNPEWLTGQRFYVNDNSVALDQRIQQFTSDWGVSLLVGSPSLLVDPGTGTISEKNSAVYYPPEGRYPNTYSKRYLVPFGEFVPGPGPLRSLFLRFTPRDPTTGEIIDYSIRPGEATVIYPVPTLEDEGTDLRVVTPICYEDAVGPYCLDLVYAPGGEKRADLMVNLTNDAWYAGTVQGYQHLQIATLRCIETRTPMARSVNTGVSGFIDSLGRVEELVQIDGQHQEIAGSASRRIRIDPRTSPYARTRQGLAVGVCAMSLLLLLGTLVPHRSERQSKKLK
ncbi:MAG: apolipoprotein N-acyltransferase [Planctomycetota bacterium]